ncbi:MAG TPA: acyl carrier protein [Pseudonocardiaceae bacterium]
MTENWDERYEKVLVGVLPRLDKAGSVAPDTNLRAVGMDSMAMVEIVARVESEYGIRLPDEALQTETFRTPAALWAVVREHVPEHR